MATEVERRPTAPVPAGNTTSPRRAGQAVAPRTTGRNLPANLSVFSILDLIGQEMALLNADLTRLGEQLVPLDQTGEKIDIAVTYIDWISSEHQAPLATRQATDAASRTAAHMADMSVVVRKLAYGAQEANAAAFVALQGMRDVQDSQRHMGADPQLLRPAGH
jgi:hypothetical protein